MTCRVDRVFKDPLEIFYVSGRIESEDLEVLRAAFGSANLGDLAIDLKDVSLVDGEAVTFLAIIEANGGTLRNCPAFIRQWIARERSRAKSPEPE